MILNIRKDIYDELILSLKEKNLLMFLKTYTILRKSLLLILKIFQLLKMILSSHQ